MATTATAIAVGVSVAALAGALIVGWSLNKSLQIRLHQSLGNVGFSLMPDGGYTAQFPERVQKEVGEQIGSFLRVAAVASAENGSSIPATAWASGGEFLPDGWALPRDLRKDEVIVNEALAHDLGANVGDWIVIRLDMSSTRPAEGLFTYRDPSDLTRTFRLKLRQIVERGEWADFSGAPTQQTARNLFVSTDVLPTGTRPNCMLFRSGLPMATMARALNRGAQMEDVGFRRQGAYLQYRGIIIPKPQAEVLGLSTGAGAVCTNIAEELTSPRGRVSYGVIAASYGSESPGDDEVVLNQWVADDLRVKVGDKITLAAMILQRSGSYGRLELPLTVSAIEASGTSLFDANVTPQVEGMTDAARMDSWKTPFPLDLTKISARDEQYWEKYHATPKAIVSWKLMQELWRQSGFEGVALTAMRLPDPERSLQRIGAFRSWLNAGDASWRIRDLVAEMDEAAVGSADFQSLFVAMSLFLIVAAVVIAAGVIATSIDARRTEIGMASAMGVADVRWRLMVLAEQVVACLPGIALGLAGGIVYAKCLVWLFVSLSRDVWEMPAVAIDVRLVPLVMAGLAVAVVVLGLGWLQVHWQLRRQARDMILLAPEQTPQLSQRKGRAAGVVAVLLAMSLTMIVLARLGAISAVGGFFAAAMGALVAGWWGVRVVLSPATAGGAREMTMASLCGHLARSNRRRVMLVFALFAAASFVVSAVTVFRSGQSVDTADRGGPTGGLALRLSSPVAYRDDLGLAGGRERFGLPAKLPEGVQIYSLLSSNGTEGGCRNLAVPGEMQVLGVSEEWITRGGFDVVTQGSQGSKDNPWELLAVTDPREPIPVFGDEETMQWIAHRSLGDVFTLPINNTAVHVRLVGLVRGGLFSGQLLMIGDQLRELLGTDVAYRYHFVQAKVGTGGDVRKLFAPLQEYGFAIEPTSRVIEGVRSVQELYMTLFVVLGGLGLLLGAGGSLVVLFRDALHRRAELALLQAAGLGRGQVTTVLMAGHVVPLVAGVVVGAGAAVLGYLALGRSVHLLWPVVVCAVIVAVAGVLLAAVARLMQPTSLAAAMHVG